jgi:hypothetical protein
MKILVFLITVLFVSCSAFSQEIPDSLKIVKDGWSFYQNDYRISAKEMSLITYGNDEAWNHVETARSDRRWAISFCSGGSFLLGYAFGRSIFTQEVNWPIVYAAVGVASVAIIFQVSYYMHLNIAMKVYNKGPKPKPTVRFKPGIKLGITGNGIGLAMRF